MPLDNAKEILKNPKFDLRKKTVLYLHGYIESMANESIHVVVDAYIKRGDHNILILDWSALAEGNYLFDAVPNAKAVKKRLSFNSYFSKSLNSLTRLLSFSWRHI